MSWACYLRKYQASSATMSSSRDRTSTVGRMWGLGDLVSSEEEGERKVRERCQQKKQEGASVGTPGGEAIDVCARVLSVQMLECVCCMN